MNASFPCRPEFVARLSRSVARTLAACVLGAALAASAAPAKVEAFDRKTWPALKTGLQRPAAVLFSATWCPNCPAVMEQLSEEIRERRLDARLMAVVMDIAPGQNDAALLRHAHYGLADRLFAFDGTAVALRHTVDPGWRGVTPYVVLLVPGQKPIVVVGPPSDGDIARWAQAVARHAATVGPGAR